MTNTSPTGPTDLELEAALSAYGAALGSRMAATPSRPAVGDLGAGVLDDRSTLAADAPAYGALGRPERPMRESGGSSRSSRLVMAAAILAFCAIAVALVVGRRQVSPASGSHGWSKLPTAPIAGRSGSAVIWTGSQFLVFGGRGPIAADQGPSAATSAPPGTAPPSQRASEHPLDGAAYDPATKQWTPIPAPPVPDGLDALVVAPASDTLTVLFGPIGCPTFVDEPVPPDPGGATFDPSTGTWVPLPPLPEEYTCSPLGARIGDTLYVWGDGNDGRTRGYALGPTGTWTSLPAPPAGVPSMGLVAVGGKIYAPSLGIGATVVQPGVPPAPTRTAVFDPATGQWTVLPDPTIVPDVLQGAFDLDGRLFVWDGQNGAILTDSNPPTWRAIATLPLTPRTGGAAAVVGGRFVVWSGWEVSGPHGGLAGQVPFTGALSDGAVYDPLSDSWQVMPAAPIAGRYGPGSAGSPEQLFVWGGTDTDQASDPQLDDGALFLPTP